MKVTIHGKNRIVERVGGKKRNAEKIAEEAFRLGMTHSETRGRLNKYLTKLYFQHPGNNNNMRVYNHKVYIFCRERMITVLPLPHNLCGIADIQQKKKQDSANIKFTKS